MIRFLPSSTPRPVEPAKTAKTVFFSGSTVLEVELGKTVSLANDTVSSRLDLQAGRTTKKVSLANDTVSSGTTGLEFELGKNRIIS